MRVSSGRPITDRIIDWVQKKSSAVSRGRSIASKIDRAVTYLSNLTLTSKPDLDRMRFESERWKNSAEIFLSTADDLNIENDGLRIEAQTDALTGLRNKGFFLQKMREELARSDRYHKPFSLLMIDLDEFKKVNDTYGHLAGDAVLKGVAGVIQGAIRKNIDFACRYGGEELAVILPETSVEVARVAAEKIRSKVEREKFMTTDGRVIPVTLSIGISGLEQANDVQAIIDLADQNLYRAKHSGRNRVVG